MISSFLLDIIAKWNEYTILMKHFMLNIPPHDVLMIRFSLAQGIFLDFFAVGFVT